MKITEGEELVRGNFMSGMLVLIAVILFVAAYAVYENKDQTEGARFAKRADDLLTNVSNVEAQQHKLFEENKAFSNAVLTLLNDVTARVVALEKPKIELPKTENVNVHLKEPVTFKVVYEGVKGNFMQGIPPQISGKNSLLHKAGITSKENN